MSSGGPRISIKKDLRKKYFGRECNLDAAFSVKLAHCLHLDFMLKSNKNIKNLKGSFTYILLRIEKNILFLLKKKFIIWHVQLGNR